MSERPPRGPGLSPSSLMLYQSCQRRYYHKISQTPADSDFSDEVESLNVGKAFHKILEDSRHELAGVSYHAVEETVKSFGLQADVVPMVFAMAASYKTMHAKSELKAIACELVVDTPTFYGIIDAVMLDPRGGGFWISDNKTAASYSSMLVPTLPRHLQLNLYAAQVHEVAKTLDLDPKDYRGCRYRLTTKSKLIRKKGEGLPEFLGRLGKAIRSFDFILPKETMDPANATRIHRQTFMAINRRIDDHAPIEAWHQNFANCCQYYRPCPNWSQCHQRLFSEMGSVETVES